MTIASIQNPKEHFILYDGLCNVSLDINISVFSKYRCRAGCEHCYIKDDFLPDGVFHKYALAKTGPDLALYKERLERLFSYFMYVTSIDDLPYLKREYPELYRFYFELSHQFQVSFSDNALFRYSSINDDNTGQYTIQDISFSSLFFRRVSLKKILEALDLLQKSAGVRKIKLVPDASDLSDVYRQIASWGEENGVLVEKQFIFGAETKDSPEVLNDIKNTRYSENGNFTEEQMYSEDLTEVFPLHSEALFLMQDDFYSELKSATRIDRSGPFATLADFDDPIKFLAKVIKGKLRDYARYIEQMKNHDNDYYRYFKYVVDHVVVNDDFNFIPSYFMQMDTMYRRRIIDSGKLQVMQYGLYDHSATRVVPICEFKKP